MASAKKINHALIMAAGRGVRLRPFTDKFPKGMIPYNGSTLIANGISKIKKYIENIHVTVGYKGDLLAQHVVEARVSSIFDTDGYGNAWWIFNTVLKHLDAPIFVLTSDNVTDLDFDHLAEDYYAKGEPLCMVVPVKPVEGLEGDYIFKDGSVITSLSRERKSDLYCSGIQILNPARINKEIPPTESFSTLWAHAIEKQSLLCSDVLPEKWFTVDSFENLQFLYNIEKSIVSDATQFPE